MTKSSTAPQSLFADDWQRPARTEHWASAFWQTGELRSSFVDYVGFPWATLIDLKRRDHFDRARQLEAKLAHFGPKKTLVRMTVCQHIWAADMLPYFKQCQITDLFWPHAPKDQPDLDGIRLHPFPLYPVAFEDRMKRPLEAVDENGTNRHLLYSFVGAYDPNLYLTPARKWVFDLPKRHDAEIKQRPGWHFEKTVYEDQIAQANRLITDDKEQNSHREQYRSLLESSIFSLCPSGAGPNTIRLWETIGSGAIPVIIADTLRLPGSIEKWKNAAIFVPETSSAIHALPKQLETLSERKEVLDSMRRAGAALWLEFITNGPMTLFHPLTKTDFLASI